MDKNLTNFMKDLDKETKQVLAKTNDKIKGTISAVKESLDMPKAAGGTPVQSGLLRSNWRVSVDNKLGDVVGSKDSVDTSAQEKAWSEFLGMEQLYLHTNIYFNNNVEYGPLVNFGTDRIAPQHFREKAIQVGNEYLKAHKK